MPWGVKFCGVCGTSMPKAINHKKWKGDGIHVVNGKFVSPMEALDAERDYWKSAKKKILTSIILLFVPGGIFVVAWWFFKWCITYGDQAAADFETGYAEDCRRRGKPYRNLYKIYNQDLLKEEAPDFHS
jgi:hypothetical protein